MFRTELKEQFPDREKVAEATVNRITTSRQNVSAEWCYSSPKADKVFGVNSSQ